MSSVKGVEQNAGSILAAQMAGVDAEPLGDAPDAADSNGSSGIQDDGESSFVVVAEKKTPTARLARTRLFSDAAAGAEHAQPFVPLSEKDIPERFEGAPVLPFATEQIRSRLLDRTQRLQFYRRWKDGELELNPAENAKVILEVEIMDQGISYSYYYPIDLGYLFSPQWRRDNLSSPSGLFRWTVEMDLALRLNMVKGYEGMRLGKSFVQKNSGVIKAAEGKACGYKRFNLSSSTILYLQTFLYHHASLKTLAPFGGNSNQVALAKEVGINHLEDLFTAVSHLTNSNGKFWVEVLGYNDIRISISQIGILLKELEANRRKYIGNHRQTALAKKVGIGHLGYLHSVLVNLTNSEGKSWTEVLKYNCIGLPVSKLEGLLKELETNWGEYVGNHRQVALAKKVGISHLGLFYSALINLTNSKGKPWAEVLEYKKIELPYAKIEPLLEVLESNWTEYVGNDKQVELAAKIGISHLGMLFSALSSLVNTEGKPWVEVLGYNMISLPRAKVELLLYELGLNWRDYRGNHRQAALAKKVGIGNLRHLFSATSNLRNSEGKYWSAVLGHNIINIPLKKIEPFFEELVSFVENSHITYLSLISILKKLTPKECHQKFLEISRSFSAVEQYIESVKREDWPESFYRYLIRTLPFIYSDNEAVETARRVIEYIEANQQQIETILGDLGYANLSYEALRPHFGEFTIPVVNFSGGFGGIWSRNHGNRGLRERLASSLPIPDLDKKRMDAFADRTTLTPLEVALIREEQAQVAVLTEALVELSADEQVIVRRVFYEGEDTEAVAISFRMGSAAFQRKLDEILSKLKELMGY